MASPVSDPGAFLEARFDEDETEAREAIRRTTITRRMVGGKMVEIPVRPVTVWGPRSIWPPERVLVDVDAKRKIIDAHPAGRDHPEDADYCLECGPATRDGKWFGYPCETVRLLMLPFAGHPEYRDEWQPTIVGVGRRGFRTSEPVIPGAHQPPPPG